MTAAEALHDKLRRLFNKPYIVEKPAADSVREIIQSLENGQHVVLSFGEHESDLDYLLVSNLLTRKIRTAWEHKTNEFRSHGKAEPRQLIIVVEEAHKLLNREMAAQTTFATIARELRKYYVTLLIVDQRPSQIYDEVMSQLGTRISGWLGDEDDIHAVLSGLSGREALARHAGAPPTEGGSAPAGLGRPDAAARQIHAATTMHSGRACSKGIAVRARKRISRNWASKSRAGWQPAKIPLFTWADRTKVRSASFESRKYYNLLHATKEVSRARKKITEFCQRWSITEFSLFGSVLREDFRPDSDIDVLVSIDPGAHIGLLEIAQMQIELENVFKRPVDLRGERSASQSVSQT